MGPWCTPSCAQARTQTPKRCSLLALSLLYSNTAAEPGSDLRCTNDYVRHMFCGFGRGSERPDPSDCCEYKLHTEVEDSYTSTERNCSFSPDPQDRLGTCGCSVNVRIVPGEEHTTTLWRAGIEVITKTIPPQEFNTSSTWSEILAKSLESSTEYLVNVKSCISSYCSESTEEKRFTT
ncbi:hypothetical protein CRUP_025889, partial [Coryphaenoides rupestris]